MKRGTELELGGGSLRGGWYLLAGSLLRCGGDCGGRVYFDDGNGWSEQRSLPLATSIHGVFHEILRLPAGVRRLRIVPGSPGCEVAAVALRPAGRLRRLWTMLRQVVAMLVTQPRARRRRIGLTLPRMLRDLPATYDAATRLRAHAPAPSYAEWILRFDTLGDADRSRIARQIASWEDPPFFHVLLAGSGDPLLRSRSRASLDEQVFRGFTRIELGPESDLKKFNEGLGQCAPDEWVVLLRAGDVLPSHALYWMAAAARAQRDAQVLYADEDSLDGSGIRCLPRFKPDWSWAHARSTCFFGEAVALRGQVLARAGGLAGEDLWHGCYAAVLRVLDSQPEARAHHIPAVLLHRHNGGEGIDDAWAMAAVRAHLKRRGIAADVEAAQPGFWRVRHHVPEPPPLVSIIVATRDALGLTRTCIESLRGLTRYDRCEILLVDNQSTDAPALAWMRQQAAAGVLRLLTYDRPFNYAAINNLAVAQARGDLVCLLNNDTEVIEPGWLEEMVTQLLQPGVEVVGAKLLYPDGRVQHAGDLVGVGGVANHAHAWLEGEAAGYCGRAAVAQEYCAVTGACLLTRRARYLALGGLDERRLPVAFNDVDYCLRVREHGGRVVWTPYARLVHHESVSRGRDRTRAQRRRARREAAYMRERWAAVLADDPFYNPNLTYQRADFSLNPAPVVPRPWQA